MFFESMHARITAEMVLAVVVILLGYYLCYRMKNHRRMRLIEHPYYLALWGTSLMFVLVFVCCMLFAIEYTETVHTAVRRTILLLSICNVYFLKKIRSDQVKQK